MANTHFTPTTQDADVTVEQATRDFLKAQRQLVSLSRAKARRAAKKAPPDTTMPKLEFANDQEVPIRRLPFVGSYADGRANFWAIPKSATPSHNAYCAGIQIGRAMAVIFADYARRNQTVRGVGLQHIVLDMFGMEPLDDDQRRGEVIGFFSTIEAMLATAMHRSGFVPDGAPDSWLRWANAAMKPWRGPL